MVKSKGKRINSTKSKYKSKEKSKTKSKSSFKKYLVKKIDEYLTTEFSDSLIPVNLTMASEGIDDISHYITYYIGLYRIISHNITHYITHRWCVTTEEDV